MADLQRLGVALRRARPFVLTADGDAAVHQLDRLELSQRMRRGGQQLSLFDAPVQARSGEL